MGKAGYSGSGKGSSYTGSLGKSVKGNYSAFSKIRGTLSNYLTNLKNSYTSMRISNPYSESSRKSYNPIKAYSPLKKVYDIGSAVKKYFAKNNYLAKASELFKKRKYDPLRNLSRIMKSNESNPQKSSPYVSYNSGLESAVEDLEEKIKLRCPKCGMELISGLCPRCMSLGYSYR